ncbi:MAG: hypothetical protein R3F38_04950 [Gammaproteobacteria bacterium]
MAFGNHANRIEARYNQGTEEQRLRSGLFAWGVAVLPWVALATIAHLSPLGFWFDCILLYLAIGRKSLFEHSDGSGTPCKAVICNRPVITPA